MRQRSKARQGCDVLIFQTFAVSRPVPAMEASMPSTAAQHSRDGQTDRKEMPRYLNFEFIPTKDFCTQKSPSGTPSPIFHASCKTWRKYINCTSLIRLSVRMVSIQLEMLRVLLRGVDLGRGTKLLPNWGVNAYQFVLCLDTIVPPNFQKR